MSTPVQESTSVAALRDQYLNLLKGTLTGLVHQNAYTIVRYSRRRHQMQQRAVGRVQDLLSARGFELHRRASEAELTEGKVWPVVGETMVGRRRLDNIQWCIETVLADEVPGDLIETGVWRGGASIFMRGVLKAYGVTDRRVWVADSFQGLPEPKADAYPADAGDRHHTQADLAIGIDTVRANFERYGLLDDQVSFLSGWFADTLPTVNDVTWSVIRLDGDMYESTMDALTNLYPRLAVGGFVIADDMALPGCAHAVEDFRRREGITEPITRVDWTGAWWRRAN